MSALAPVTLRFARSFRVFMLLGFFMFWGMFGLSLLLPDDPKHGDWTLTLALGSLALLYTWFSLVCWTVRYEFSGSGLICRGWLIPRKRIYWDQLESVHIAVPNEVKLKGRDGTVLSVPAAFLDGGEQLVAFLQEVAGVAPVQSIRGTAQSYGYVKRLPHFVIGGGMAAVLFATIGGYPWLVLGGGAIGILYALVSLWSSRAAARGKVGSISWIFMFYLLWTPMYFMLMRSEGPALLLIGSILSGGVFSASLVLLPFRKRLLSLLEGQDK